MSVMSDSVRPHRRQPTRLPHPWGSPGKNTGVGCHFLFQCMKVNSESEVSQSCLTPSDPMDCSPPGSSVPGIFQARGLEWGAIAFSYWAWKKTREAQQEKSTRWAQEKPWQWEAHAPQLEDSFCWLPLEKPRRSNEEPVLPKIIKH